MQSLMDFFIESFTIGFVLASYIGPVSIFIIKRTIDKGFLTGLSSSLGASLGDLSYILAVSMGLIYTPDNVIYIVKIVGSIVVIGIAILELHNSRKAVMQTPQHAVAEVKRSNIGLCCKSLAIAYVIVAAHPMSFVLFISIVSSVVGVDFEFHDALAVAFGMFTGGILLRILLTTLIFKTRHLISNKLFSRVRAIAAILLMGFGFFTLYEVFVV